MKKSENVASDVKKRKTVRILGKTIPVWLIVMVALAGIGSATLLVYYGTIATTVSVQQSILLDSKGADIGSLEVADTITEQAPGGETFCFKHNLTNQMSVEGAVSLAKECTPDCEGITTNYYKIEPKTTLILENKDPTNGWALVTNDSTKAVLTFDTVNPTFDYTINVTGIEPSTEYKIIYYADDLTGPHGIAVPIGTFTTESDGSYVGSGSSDIGLNLPSEPDRNIAIHNHCSPDIDNYQHCFGAKIWIVPSSDLSGNTLSWANFHTLPFPNYLFETDLVVYLDCDKPVEGYFTTLVGSPVSGVIIPPKDMKDLLVCYGFDKKIYPGVYTVTTKVDLQ